MNPLGWVSTFRLKKSVSIMKRLNECFRFIEPSYGLTKMLVIPVSCVGTQTVGLNLPEHASFKAST